MIGEHADRDKPPTRAAQGTNDALHQLPRATQESVRTALILLLGPETEYVTRVRATRRLVRQGPDILPLVLATLNTHPEIASPPWPWWPPQYEHAARLLLQLSHKAGLSLDALLQHPAVTQPVGPVLWTSTMEATGLLAHFDYEELLRAGLESSWVSVRYAAAMSLAMRASKTSLHTASLEALRRHQNEHEEFPVRLAASYALLCAGESVGIDALIPLLSTLAPEEARKAAAFVLATELPLQLSPAQHERLTQSLLNALHDSNAEVAIHAAHALSSIALPSLLPSLSEMLDLHEPEIQIVALTTLEEMAHRAPLRRYMQHHALPARIMPLLKAESAEVRRQACYTLAACGGEYATAVLGTVILSTDHPAHLQAIEGLRLLYGVLRAPTRTNVVRWLLQVLRQARQEEELVTALDSLVYLLWQCQNKGQRRVSLTMSQEIAYDETLLRQFYSSSAWVRQRAIELAGMLLHQPALLYNKRIVHLLHSDEDSGVRACIAYVFGKIRLQQAIPELIEALLDPDEHVAETALNSLGQLMPPAHPLYLYILQELSLLDDAADPAAQHLGQAARALLKKWHRANASQHKKLHSQE